MARSPIEADSSSSLLKYAWAEHHLNALKMAVGVYEKSQPAVIRSHFKPHRPGYDLTFHVIKWPQSDISLMAGDVVGCLRDALDHLIYELTTHHAGVPARSHQTAWPVCEYRSQWPMRKGSKARVDHRSGEWKVHGIHPKARALVYRHQPIYRKHKPGPHRRHSLWMLDELRNLDRHRRLSIVATTSAEYEVIIKRYNASVQLVRRKARFFAPTDGAIVERIWLSRGAKEADMSVDAVPSCKLVLQEPSAIPRRTELIETLDSLARKVRIVLGDFLEFEPRSVQDFVKGPPWIEV